MRITTALVLIAVLFAIMTAAAADPTVKVTFPEKGAYIYWLEYKDALGKAQVTAPKHAQGADAAVDLAPAAPGGKLGAGALRIYDPKSGNSTSKKLENLAGKKELKLKTADFDLVRTVRIVLKPAEAKPDERVESAVVTLKDANSDEFTVLVDPLSEGVAEFHDVAAGQESLTVAYDGGKMSVDLEVPADRSAPVFTHPLVISADVRKVKATGGQASPVAAGRGKAKPAPVLGLLPILIGLVFVCFIVLIIYIVLKAKGASFEGGLRKLGVEFPQDAEGVQQVPGTAAPAGPQVDPNTCPYCGQRKDPVTGACACSVTAGAASIATGGVARLIGTQGPYAGHVFELTSDQTMIGRDTANAIPLDQDSTTSRRHAMIGRENGAYVIADQGSSNGTFVNGAKISGSQPLTPGDEVQIGSTKFRFEA